MKEPLRYSVRQCSRQACGLRYPVVDGHPYGERCPRCGASTVIVMSMPMKREFVYRTTDAASPYLEALLDNIRSAWNVGSMFRTADGLGIHRLHLCGMTPTPENPKVVKTSLGAERNVEWRQYNDGLQAARSLMEQGLHLWALEDCPQAESLVNVRLPPPEEQVVLVVGNEISGVDPEILSLCERVILIPMQGVKRSFNAAVAFGIAVYYLSESFTSRFFPKDLSGNSLAPG